MSSAGENASADSGFTLDRRLPALDGLRGIAILLVIVSHYCGLYRPWATVGWTGVNLFFVLSGFLITGILLDAKGQPHYFRNFYARRTLRIFPLYYLALFLMFAVAPLFPALRSPEYWDVAREQHWLWLYLSNLRLSFFEGAENLFNGGWVRALHFWSLAVEEQFYLVWPAVVLVLPRRALIGFCVGCIVVAAGLRIWFTENGNIVAPYFFTLCRMDDLAVGGLVAAILRESWGIRFLRRAVWPALIVSAGVLIWQWIVFDELKFWQHSPMVQKWSYTPFGLFYASLLTLAVILSDKNIYTRALSFLPLRSIGKYSYAIYIYHWALFVLVFEKVFPYRAYEDETNASLLARVVVVTVITYGIAWLSWHLYEKHFLKLKRHFYGRPEESRRAAALESG